MKLIKNQTVRISETQSAEIAKVAEAMGESKQTVIRLSVWEGLAVLKQKYGEKNHDGRTSGLHGDAVSEESGQHKNPQ